MADVIVLLFLELCLKSSTWKRNVTSLMTFVNVLRIQKDGVTIQTPALVCGNGEGRGGLCFYMMASSLMVGGSWIVSYPVVCPGLCVSY